MTTTEPAAGPDTGPDTAAYCSALRWVALTEALSWLALIVATIVKYATDPHQEGGVKVLGPIHGILFVAYVVLAIVVARRLGWTLRTVVVVLAESIVPFGGFLVFRRPDLR